MHQTKSHEFYLSEALRLAAKAEALDEVPIGAVLVQDGKIISEGYNRREQDKSPLGHAEIMAIEEACRKLKTWRLSDCDLYVTLEPCLMCAGALVQSRIRAVYFGAFDPKGGALGSLYKINEDMRLNHRFPATGGICADQCGTLLREFFQKKRKKSSC